MTVKYLNFILPLFLLLTACSTDEAEKVANIYHAKMDKGEYDYIVENLSLANTPKEKEKFKNMLLLIDSYGTPKNRNKQLGNDIQNQDSLTTVKLKYQFETEMYGAMYERLILINDHKGNGYKILTIVTHSNEAKADAITEAYL